MGELTTALEKESVAEERNPFLIPESEFIDAATIKIFTSVIKVSKELNLSKEEMGIVMDALEKVYLERKTKAFFNKQNSHLNHILDRLNNLISGKLNSSTPNLYYYNSIKHKITDEWG